MYSHIIMATGWTWDYIDDFMTLPRLYAMHEYWKQWPPVHIIQALKAGIKPKQEVKTAEDMQKAMDELSGMGGFQVI
jgi:hypothetical protein